MVSIVGNKFLSPIFYSTCFTLHFSERFLQFCPIATQKQQGTGKDIFWWVNLFDWSGVKLILYNKHTKFCVYLCSAGILYCSIYIKWHTSGGGMTVKLGLIVGLILLTHFSDNFHVFYSTLVPFGQTRVRCERR